MKLFLHLEIKKWQESAYDKPLVSYASSLSSDLVGAELDSQSDGAFADLVIKLCDQSSRVFLFIHATPDEPMGASLKVLNHLLRTEEKIYSLVLSGEHAALEKTAGSLTSRFRKEHDAEKIKEWVREFASA